MGGSAKRAVFATVLVGAAACLVNAQSPGTGTGTGTGLNVNPNGLETEVVTIADDIAFPSAITRTQGQFFLLLLNKARRGPANIVFDSTTASAAQIPILGQALNLPALAGTRQIASIFNPPPGVYQLKRQSDGKVLLTITITE
jgi:hypothetical protein